MRFKDRIKAIADKVMKTERNSESSTVAGERKPDDANRINRQMYQREMPEEENRKVLSGIRIRFMYGKISQSLREEVLLALEENGRELPEEMKKAILHDMKYV